MSNRLLAGDHFSTTFDMACPKWPAKYDASTTKIAAKAANFNGMTRAEVGQRTAQNAMTKATATTEPGSRYPKIS